MNRVLNIVGGGIGAILAFIVGAIVAVAFIGLVIPYDHSICLSGTMARPEVDSHWGLYLSNGLPNPAPDDERCVRNTPTREAMSMLGIWKLGSPENQLADHLTP